MNFLLGICGGFLVGLLIAPGRGKQNREWLESKARDAIEIPKRKAEEQARELARRTEQKAGEVGGEIGRKAAEAAAHSITDELLGDKKPA